MASNYRHTSVLFIGIATILLLAVAVKCINSSNSSDVTDHNLNAAATSSFRVLFDFGQLVVHAVSEQFRRVIDAVFASPDFTRPMTYVIGAAAAILIYYLFSLIFVPMNRIRPLGSVGYITNGRESAKDVMESVRKRRDAGDVPPVYPNGWFCVIESRDVGIGDVRDANCIGKQLAVFRAENGQVHVLDAYCPHNGANMAAGGIVRGNCLECPFHGWQFHGEDGKCTKIPYCEEKYIPESAKVTSYATIERNGFIFIWFHAEGAEPSWEPPDIEQIANGQWTWRGRTEHIVNAHIEEIPENGADVAHLSQVHGPIWTAGIDLRFMYNKWWSFARHEWKGQWYQDPDPDQKHVGVLDLEHDIQVLGFNFSALNLKLQARQIGPSIVHMLFDTPLGSGCYIQTLTPIEPMTQRVIHSIYFQRNYPTILAKFFMLVEALMVERDIMIWNNKRYVRKPVFVKSKEDALVQRHRRWYSQFYSEHSPRLRVHSDIEW